MYYFGFVNMTSAEEHGIKFVVSTIMKAELFFVCLSLFAMTLSMYVMLATTQYHINLSWIFVNFAFQYFVSLLARIYLIISQLIYGGENLIGSSAFDLAVFLRTLCTLTCLIVYTGVVFERVLATIWVKDYENKARKWIPILVIPLTYVGSGTCTYLMYAAPDPSNPYSSSFGASFTRIPFEALNISTIALTLVLLNILDSIVTFSAFSYSKKRVYDKTVVLEGVLSWRYQQEENYRSWELLRYLLCVIVFFNILMGLCLMAPDYLVGDVSHIRNLSSVALDQTILTYGLVAPSVALYFNKLWQRELYRIMGKCGLSSLVSSLSANSVGPLGHAEFLQGHAQQDVYFNQLKKEWSTPRRAEIATGK